jgi:hypothetical protein
MGTTYLSLMLGWLVCAAGVVLSAGSCVSELTSKMEKIEDTVDCRPEGLAFFFLTIGLLAFLKQKGSIRRASKLSSGLRLSPFGRLRRSLPPSRGESPSHLSHDFAGVSRSSPGVSLPACRFSADSAVSTTFYSPCRTENWNAAAPIHIASLVIRLQCDCCKVWCQYSMSLSHDLIHHGASSGGSAKAKTHVRPNVENSKLNASSDSRKQTGKRTHDLSRWNNPPRYVPFYLAFRIKSGQGLDYHTIFFP